MANAPQTSSKVLRDEHPSGWIALTRNESVLYMIDALLDLQLHREFNQAELAERAGVSRHLELLLTAGIIEPVGNTSPKRYRFNEESPVSTAIVRLDGAMNAAGVVDQ